MRESITKESLRKLVDEWISSGRRAAGAAQTAPGKVLYSQLRSAAQLLLDGGVMPANSLKEFVFPRHEKLYGYRIVGDKVELLENGGEDRVEQLLIAARPCDAAALPVLDHIFNWDYKDEFYNWRRQMSTIVTIACLQADDACFCTSVGLSPDSERGSDALLLPLEDGRFEVKCLTEKGRQLFAGRTEQVEAAALPFAAPEQQFEAAHIREFVQKHFASPFWREHSLACMGCGVCAYTCPTCHCFDIADEGNAVEGARVRNWDTCQFPVFTVHASGHNPRNEQPDRQRQRIYHKFFVYPEKFGEILCTGCGNCTRNCPVGLGVLGLVSEMDRHE